MSDLILYTSEDGESRLQLRVDGATIWLSQAEIAELFQTTKQNVSLHAKNILEDGELRADSVVKDSLTTAASCIATVKESLTVQFRMNSKTTLAPLAPLRGEGLGVRGLPHSTNNRQSIHDNQSQTRTRS